MVNETSTAHACTILLRTDLNRTNATSAKVITYNKSMAKYAYNLQQYLVVSYDSCIAKNVKMMILQREMLIPLHKTAHVDILR